MTKKQTPGISGIQTRLRHDSGRFARNQAQPTKDVHAIDKTPAKQPPADPLHEEAQRDLASQIRRAKVKG